MSIKYPFITNLVLGKVEKEDHIRKVQESEERKVNNIGKIYFCSLGNFCVQVCWMIGKLAF